MCPSESGRSVSVIFFFFFFPVVKYKDFGSCSEIRAQVWSSYENGSEVLFFEKHFDSSAEMNHLLTS